MSGPVPRYVDEVAVERARKGDRQVTLNRQEVALAFAFLNGRGDSAAQIARVLGVTSRTVTRWRSGRHFPISRAPRAPRIPCRACGLDYAPSYMAKHITRAHPEALNNPVDNGLGKAS